MPSPEAEDRSPLDPEVAALLTRNPQGLVPAVVQEATTGAVLMLAWMNDEALHRTLTTGRGTYFSRSRNKLWVKGEESGHVQWVREVRLDCDGDTILLRVDQVGPACHTGTTTCFDAVVLPADTTRGPAPEGVIPGAAAPDTATPDTATPGAELR